MFLIVCVCVSDRAITQPYGSDILFFHQTGRMYLGLACVIAGLTQWS